MAGLFSKVSRFARSPQGRRAMSQARRLAQDPKNRERIAGFRNRLGKRR